MPPEQLDLRGGSQEPSSEDTMLVFPSKQDVWLVGLLWLIVVALGFSMVKALAGGPSGPARLVSGLIEAAALLLVVSCLLVTNYSVQGSRLSVRSGPFSWSILIDSIVSITRTHSLLSAPALSLDRLRIETKTGAIVVSPRDRQGFVKALQKRRPDLTIVD
jgi:uncharacterized membrane protein YhaH (DUF805 family)